MAVERNGPVRSAPVPNDRIANLSPLMERFVDKRAHLKTDELHAYKWTGQDATSDGIAFYGISAWRVPTIMAAAVGDYLGPTRAAKTFGFITLFFGLGQIVGPALAGFIADASGTFRSAFGMCAAATMTAAILAFFLPRTRP